MIDVRQVMTKIYNFVAGMPITETLKGWPSRLMCNYDVPVVRVISLSYLSVYFYRDKTSSTHPDALVFTGLSPDKERREKLRSPWQFLKYSVRSL